MPRRQPKPLLLLAIIFGSIFGYLLITGTVRLPGALTGFQAIAFDPTSSVTGGTFYNCNASWYTSGFNIAVETSYPCSTVSNPTTSTGNYCGPTRGGIPCSGAIIGGGGPVQGFTLNPLIIGADSNDQPTPGIFGGTFPSANCRNSQQNLLGPSYSGACAHSSVYLTSTVTGNVQYPYNKVDTNFQNLYGADLPTCNPCTIGSNSTTNFMMYEYGGAVRISRTDSITNSVNCFNVNGVLGATLNLCTGAETDATNQALNGFVNVNDKTSITLVLDLTVPNSLALTSKDQFGMVGVWSAKGSTPGPNGCILSNNGAGYTFTGTTCSPNTIIQTPSLPFTPFASANLGTFNAGQFSTTLVKQLPSTIQFISTVTIQPKYTASCPAGDTNCSSGQAPVIGNNPITVDIPFLFDVLDATPITCGAGQNLSNGTCVTPVTCPTGQTLVNGVCTQNCTNGATNPPACNNQTGNQSCPFGGTYPNCNTCPTGQVLQNGVCVPVNTCPTGYTASLGQCISTQNNGMCGSTQAFNISGIGCPKLVNPNGNIVIHVIEQATSLPLGGVQVAANSASMGACSTTTGVLGTTDNNGNYLFANLATSNGGAYVICATGSTGTVTLIFIVIGITYTAASTTCSAVASITVTCNLPLATNFFANPTTFAIGFIVFIVIAAAIVIGLTGFSGSRRGVRIGGKLR